MHRRSVTDVVPMRIRRAGFAHVQQLKRKGEANKDANRKRYLKNRKKNLFCFARQIDCGAGKAGRVIYTERNWEKRKAATREERKNADRLHRSKAIWDTLKPKRKKNQTRMYRPHTHTHRKNYERKRLQQRSRVG